MVNLDVDIQELSNVYITMQEIEIKGKQSMPYAVCLQKLEQVINDLKQKSQEIQSNESPK